MPIPVVDFRPISFEEAAPQYMAMHRSMNDINAMQQNLLARQLQAIQAKYAEPLNQAELLKSALANQKSQAELPYAAENLASLIKYRNAQSNYMGSPQQLFKSLTPTGKLFTESSGQLPFLVNSKGGLVNNPNFGNPGSDTSYNDETNTSTNPAKSAYAREIQIKTTNPKMLQDAQNAQALYNEVNKIDIEPLQYYAGAAGKTKLLADKAKGIASSFGIASLGEPSQEFKKYNEWKMVHQNAIVDTIRKMLNTSIQPKYIKNNLYPMLEPENPIWSNPDQVAENIKGLQRWVKDYTTEKTKAIQNPIPTKLSNEKNDFHNVLSGVLKGSSTEIPENLGAQIVEKGIPQPSKNIMSDSQIKSTLDSLKTSKDKADWANEQSPEVQERIAAMFRGKRK